MLMSKNGEIGISQAPRNGRALDENERPSYQPSKASLQPKGAWNSIKMRKFLGAEQMGKTVHQLVRSDWPRMILVQDKDSACIPGRAPCVGRCALVVLCEKKSAASENALTIPASCRWRTWEEISTTPQRLAERPGKVQKLCVRVLTVQLSSIESGPDSKGLASSMASACRHDFPV